MAFPLLIRRLINQTSELAIKILACASEQIGSPTERVELPLKFKVAFLELMVLALQSIQSPRKTGFLHD
jgi:hypothetical protein